jgi:ABC-type transport system substrate-binding protein
VVTIWRFTDLPMPSRVVGELKAALRRLGYRPRVRAGSHAAYARLPRAELAAIDVIPASWLADFPSPATFFDTFLACRSVTAGGFSCDPGLDALLRRARRREAVDPASADPLWAAADRRAVDRAAWAPLVNPRSVELVSARLRDYQYHALWGFLASQASLRP